VLYFRLLALQLLEESSLDLSMSRSHDGHSMSSFFGNPFRVFIRKRSFNSSPRLGQLLRGFEDALAERLERLKLNNPKDFIDLTWMQQAIEVLCTMHSDLRSFVVELRFPISKWDKKWIDQYLDDTVNLLDICIALNAEISWLDHRHLIVQYVLHLLNFSDGMPSSDKLCRANDHLRDLRGETKSQGKNGASQTNRKIEDCAARLEGMCKSLHLRKVKSSGKGKVLLRAMYGLKATTIFICSILVSMFEGSSRPLVDLSIPDQFSWSAQFMSLQQEVNEKIKGVFATGRVTVMKELEGLDAAVKNVHSMIQMLSLNISGGKEGGFQITEGSEQAEKLRQSVQELQQRADLLSQGLDPVAKQVNAFFQTILKGRNALLDSLRFSGDNDMQIGDELFKK